MIGRPLLRNAWSSCDVSVGIIISPVNAEATEGLGFADLIVFAHVLGSGHMFESNVSVKKGRIGNTPVCNISTLPGGPSSPEGAR